MQGSPAPRTTRTIRIPDRRQGAFPMTMTMPKIFVPGGSPEDARAAEAAGVDGVFVGDHVTFYGSGSDGLMKLAPIAAVTTKLELQTCVYLLALRHPTPVA